MSWPPYLQGSTTNPAGSQALTKGSFVKLIARDPAIANPTIYDVTTGGITIPAGQAWNISFSLQVFSNTREGFNSPTNSPTPTSHAFMPKFEVKLANNSLNSDFALAQTWDIQLPMLSPFLLLETWPNGYQVDGTISGSAILYNSTGSDHTVFLWVNYINENTGLAGWIAKPPIIVDNVPITWGASTTVAAWRSWIQGYRVDQGIGGGGEGTSSDV